MLAGLLERTMDRLINPAIVHHKMRRPTRCWCSGPVRTFPQRLLVDLLASRLRRAAGLTKLRNGHSHREVHSRSAFPSGNPISDEESPVRADRWSYRSRPSGPQVASLLPAVEAGRTPVFAPVPRETDECQCCGSVPRTQHLTSPTSGAKLFSLGAWRHEDAAVRPARDPRVILWMLNPRHLRAFLGCFHIENNDSRTKLPLSVRGEQGTCPRAGAAGHTPPSELPWWEVSIDPFPDHIESRSRTPVSEVDGTLGAKLKGVRYEHSSTAG